MYERMLTLVVDEQTQRLIDYAKKEVVAIGNLMESYYGPNHLDRTGNLIDSLCWGVSYGGKLQDSGFYRAKKAVKESQLHAWSERWVPVNGRALAEKYLQTFGNNGARGWKVFWAILAPYWGYWEKGFTIKHHGVPKAHLQWAVMTVHYDKIKQDLKAPMRKRIRISVNLYDHEKINEPWD